MNNFIIKESQLKFLIETGSNSAAMDLDIYVQPVEHDTSNGNENIIDSIEETISYLNQLSYQLKNGQEMSEEQKSKFFGILDDLRFNFFQSTEN
jgi:hypothetical protein